MQKRSTTDLILYIDDQLSYPMADLHQETDKTDHYLSTNTRLEIHFGWIG